MELSVLVVLVIWFITGFIINHAFENDKDDLTKQRFHLAAALQLIIHMIAMLTVITLIFDSKY
jgi:ACR3 family arsenite efflux pump ArsB